MKIKILFVLPILLFVATAFGQQKMTAINQKEYNATPVWEFVCENYAYSGILKVQIAKTENGGLLKVSVAANSKNLYIGDRIFVSLKDGSLIYCTDKGMRANTTDELVSFYSFTAAEMNKLKAITIDNIRFKIVGKASKFSSQTGHFTAVNKNVDFDTYGSKDKIISTQLDIQSLYK